MLKVIFFICSLATLRPTLGNYRWDGLTHPTVITALGAGIDLFGLEMGES